jgi:hypothetical protein
MGKDIEDVFQVVHAAKLRSFLKRVLFSAINLGDLLTLALIVAFRNSHNSIHTNNFRLA